MCGRYTLKTPVERLSEQFQFPQIIPLKPRHNIAPSQSVAVVRVLPEAADRKLALLRWGLIPAWVKDPSKSQQPINAKAETAAEKPMFRDAFKRRRCLVLADGFYEWKQEGGRKQPPAHSPNLAMAYLFPYGQRGVMPAGRGEASQAILADG